jgi:hypothetical protein
VHVTITVELPEESLPAFYRFMADVYGPTPAGESEGRGPCEFCERPIPLTRRAGARYCDHHCRANAAYYRRQARRLRAVS